MGESVRLSSLYNPTLSVNKHVVQICCFSLSAGADLADGSRERRTWPFIDDTKNWNGIERSLSRAVVPQSLPVSTTAVPTVLSLYHIAQGRLRKNIRYPSYSQRQNCCHLKRKNTSTWSVLLAWSMPTKCHWVIHGRLTSECKPSFSPSSSINLSIPPLKHQAPCLYMLAWISLLLFAFLHQWAHSSTWIDLLAIESLRHWVRVSTWRVDACGRGNHMHDHSRFQRDIDRCHKRLSLSLSLSTIHKKSLAYQARKRLV